MEESPWALEPAENSVLYTHLGGVENIIALSFIKVSGNQDQSYGDINKEDFTIKTREQDVTHTHPHSLLWVRCNIRRVLLNKSKVRLVLAQNKSTLKVVLIKDKGLDILGILP